MKIFSYLKVKKNRYLAIAINIIMSIILSIFAVMIDERYGKSGLTTIYILQTICIINWVIAFSLIVLNIWFKSKKKLEKRDKNNGLS